MIAPALFRSPLVLSTTLILLATAAIVQFGQTQVPTKEILSNEPPADRLSQPIVPTGTQAIDTTGGVWCGKNLQTCLK